jgi:hypothetical protein
MFALISWLVTSAVIYTARRMVVNERADRIERLGRASHRVVLGNHLPDGWDSGPLIGGFRQDIIDEETYADRGDVFVYRVRSDMDGRLYEFCMEYPNDNKVEVLLNESGYMLVQDKKNPRDVLIRERPEGGSITINFNRRGVKSPDDFKFLRNALKPE